MQQNGGFNRTTLDGVGSNTSDFHYIVTSSPISVSHPALINIEFSNKVKVDYLNLINVSFGRNVSDTRTNSAWRDYTFQGSNDKTTWIILHERQNRSNNNRYMTTDNIINSEKFKYYRFMLTRTHQYILGDFIRAFMSQINLLTEDNII